MSVGVGTAKGETKFSPDPVPVPDPAVTRGADSKRESLKTGPDVDNGSGEAEARGACSNPSEQGRGRGEGVVRNKGDTPSMGSLALST